MMYHNDESMIDIAQPFAKQIFAYCACVLHIVRCILPIIVYVFCAHLRFSNVCITFFIASVILVCLNAAQCQQSAEEKNKNTTLKTSTIIIGES